MSGEARQQPTCKRQQLLGRTRPRGGREDDAVIELGGVDVLQAEGYIRGYSEIDSGNGKAELQIELKYYEGASVIREIGRVSKPGRRVYVSVKSIPQVANGLGITILSTPKGVMADHQAREQNVGGEVLCSVF